MTFRWPVVAGILLLTHPAFAAPSTMDVVRDLATRVGPIVGSAQACNDIERGRIQIVADKFAAVIQEASSDPAARSGLAEAFDRSVKDGADLVTSKRMDCAAAQRQLAELERSLGITRAGPALSAMVAPSTVATAAPGELLPALGGPAVHGVTDNEIRFGIVGPLTGSARELGRQMKLGIEAAFAKANDAGGINGRRLKLIAADDGYDPSRTLEAMKQLYEKENVFGFVGNFGSSTAAVALPYALEHHAIFFGSTSGASVVRHDPPDRYVFNYRASFVEEADALVRYLLKVRKIPPRQIAVFQQDDSFGEAAYNGVTKAYRALGISDVGILKLTYKRNTVDVEDAVNQLRLQKVPIRAVVMAGIYRASAKFIEQTRDLFPDMIYGNISGTGPSGLADELMLLGPRFTNNVIVSQIAPAVSGYSSLVLDYRSAVTKYFPGEAADYFSLEGYISASILIDALRRCGPQLDSERLVEVLEDTHNLDLGLGTPVGFGRGEHQAVHKVWGTELDEAGKYQPIELE